MPQTNSTPGNPLIKAIFFDAAGTLIHVAEPVGQTYCRIAGKHGIEATAEAMEAGFRQSWKQHPPLLHAEGARSDDDDKSWWSSLFSNALHASATKPPTPEQVSSAFEEAYAHYAKAEAWHLYPDVKPALETLYEKWPLWVLSNFDRRLHAILHGLDLMRFFSGVIVSSEVGASKPHRRIFERAVSATGLPAGQCLHVGDEEEADGAGAQAAGLQWFLLRRPGITLKNLLIKLQE